MAENRYIFNCATYAETQLQTEVNGVVPGCTGVCGSGTTVTFIYQSALTQANLASIQTVVTNHVPIMTDSQKLGLLQVEPIVIVSAIAFRLSSSWALATVAQQTRVSNLLNSVGTKVLAALT